MRGDRTRDQSIKSRTLYQTELARHIVIQTKRKKKKEPQAGFEPTTFRLLSECSTPKLLRRAMLSKNRKKIPTPGFEPGSCG